MIKPTGFADALEKLGSKIQAAKKMVLPFAEMGKPGVKLTDGPLESAR